MRIGIDFDNTLICYDQVFEVVAKERGWISELFLGGKGRVKEEVVQRWGNDIWTELQGLVYGERIACAEPYLGVREFFEEAHRRADQIIVVSHKTEKPVRGPNCDLREKAREWLRENRFDDFLVGTYFCGTRREKVEKIAELGVDVFIDDLPEVFLEPGFPEGTRKILFDPESIHTQARWIRVTEWKEMGETLGMGLGQ